MSNPNSPTSFCQLPIAGVGRRLAALGYDALIIVGLLMVFMFLALMIASSFSGLNCNPQTADYTPCVRGPLLQFGMLVVIAGYFVWSWRAAGQTIGMRAWRLILASPQGVQLGWRQCGLRLLVAPVSLACFGIGYFWAWTRSDRASWQDLASNSQVRLLPKK
ncbi:RDD family protein [Microbulbifer sp. 2201CG32-9]|uniref:RDD family protein n=1 Tax=unclassified Microbulbifer TaxID=2619833 RepID=UPI00345C5B1A